ncbi:MAG: nuclear transport factor 2 family protein [Nitrosomonadaceae bacterium]
MNTVATDANEYDAINKIIQVYIEGAKSGNSAVMSPAFHKDATIFGYIGPDLFAGPIQKLFDWNNENGPATDLQAQIANVDLFDTVATLRLELTNWTGFRFTDLFTLLKIDGKWKIMNKVFHLHS